MIEINVYTKNSPMPFCFKNVEWWSETRKTLEIIQEEEYTTVTNVFYKTEIERYTLIEKR